MARPAPSENAGKRKSMLASMAETAGTAMLGGGMMKGVKGAMAAGKSMTGAMKRKKKLVGSFPQAEGTSV